MTEGTRFVAIVKNGKIKGVYSDDPGALCEVIDCDVVIDEGAGDGLDEAIEREIEGLTRVWEQP